MKTYNLSDSLVPLPVLELKPGMAILLYMDDGPGGPCGQSMSTTCPHQAIHVFENEAAMRAWVEKHGARRGLRSKKAYCVIGEYGTGNMSLCVHEGGGK